MSRWLLHYSPFAVLVRLCSLSILLSYASTRLFYLTDATVISSSLSSMQHLRKDKPESRTRRNTAMALATGQAHLDRALPVWICISVAMLILYFSTQQDISIDEDQDDEGRRQSLRVKCLGAVATASFLSLAVILAVLHLGNEDVNEWAIHKAWEYGKNWLREVSGSVTKYSGDKLEL